jgi:NarL family two-component system response regulator LiaR
MVDGGMIRIVVADDHPLLRAGTRDQLSKEPDFEVLASAEDGRQALEMIARFKPDVAVLDIRLPKLNGIAVVRRMREVSPATRSLILTAFDDDDYIIALMELGAASYLLKTVRPDELNDAVRRVHRGETVLDRAISDKIVRLWARRPSQPDADPTARLTPRELDVLKRVAEGMRNRDIAEALHVSPDTVAHHLSSTYEKLEISSRAQAVRYAWQHHLVGEDAEKPEDQF